MGYCVLGRELSIAEKCEGVNAEMPKWRDGEMAGE